MYRGFMIAMVVLGSLAACAMGYGFVKEPSFFYAAMTVFDVWIVYTYGRDLKALNDIEKARAP